MSTEPNTTAQPVERSRLVGGVAGVGSGLTKVAVGHGFDTIKTRVQVQQYHSAWEAFVKTVRNEGPLALYKGATPPALGWSIIDSLLMGSLHVYRLHLRDAGFVESTPGSGTPRLTLLGHGFAGLLAGTTSTIVATPVEQIKVKLQLQQQRHAADRQFKSPIDCIRQIVRVQGVSGLWSGFTGTVMMRTNFFWMFLSVEAFMRGFSRFEQISTPTANFLSGGFASLVFWTLGIPADTVKNRMMAHPYPEPYPGVGATALKRPSFLSVAREIYRKDGPRGFYRGLAPCILRAFPVNACALLVYESILRALDAEKTRH
ncbi:mitochondrial carrier domain-containing protein [Schizophyllum amplum]|uniref:Mitochondrial carrier domain-containing protein n=1 Tax=Schizophyllum amplum TaxID=97359 RepID=A0A550C625_9AGAR|nr:mitochondrial carrier domain-containing protein [Auriculariopsis ampla]